MSALLDVRDACVHFGGVKALDGVDLQVEQGTVHGLIGPNGAGKTTLLNLVSRIVPATTGQVTFDGRSLLQARAHRLAELGIFRTFQNLVLIEDASVLDNVMIGSHASEKGSVIDELLFVVRGLKREAARREGALRALATLGIADLADRVVASLSYGQRKMVELARALVGRPKLLLLDEPTAGLNGGEIESLRTTLRAICEASGLTVLVITHHVEFLMGLARRVTVLDLGRTICQGTPEDVRNDPRVIAAYIGVDA